MRKTIAALQLLAALAVIAACGGGSDSNYDSNSGRGSNFRPWRDRDSGTATAAPPSQSGAAGLGNESAALAGIWADMDDVFEHGGAYKAVYMELNGDGTGVFWEGEYIPISWSADGGILTIAYRPGRRGESWTEVWQYEAGAGFLVMWFDEGGRSGTAAFARWDSVPVFAADPAGDERLRGIAERLAALRWQRGPVMEEEPAARPEARPFADALAGFNPNPAFPSDIAILIDLDGNGAEEMVAIRTASAYLGEYAEIVGELAIFSSAHEPVFFELNWRVSDGGVGAFLHVTAADRLALYVENNDWGRTHIVLEYSGGELRTINLSVQWDSDGSNDWNDIYMRNGERVPPGEMAALLREHGLGDTASDAWRPPAVRRLWPSAGWSSSAGQFVIEPAFRDFDDRTSEILGIAEESPPERELPYGFSPVDAAVFINGELSALGETLHGWRNWHFVEAYAFADAFGFRVLHDGFPPDYWDWHEWNWLPGTGTARLISFQVRESGQSSLALNIGTQVDRDIAELLGGWRSMGSAAHSLHMLTFNVGIAPVGNFRDLYILANNPELGDPRIFWLDGANWHGEDAIQKEEDEMRERFPFSFVIDGEMFIPLEIAMWLLGWDIAAGDGALRIGADKARLDADLDLAFDLMRRM